MFKASNGKLVSFKSAYQGESDYLVYDRATNEEHRVRVMPVGEFAPICSGHAPTDAEKIAVAEFRHHRDGNDGI